MGSDAIIRVSKTERYAIIDKQFLDEDSRLSWKAKGLLAYLLAKPDGWQIRRSDLISRAADGKDSVSAGLRELERFGYLERKMVRQGGKFGYENIIHERPETPDIKPFSPGRKIRSGSTVAEKPLRKIRRVLSNELLNTKEKQQRSISDHRSIVDQASNEKGVAAVVVSGQPQILTVKQQCPATDDGAEKKAMTPGAISCKLAGNSVRSVAAVDARVDRPDKPYAMPREARQLNNYAAGRGLAHAVDSNARLRGIAADSAVRELIGYAAERGVCNMDGNLALTLLAKARGGLDHVKAAVDRFAKFASTTPVHKPNKVLIDALAWPPEVKFDRDIYKRHLAGEREKRLAEKEKYYEDVYAN